jgi:hypothetical protein
VPVKPPYIRYYGDQAEGPKYLRRAESELYRTVEFANQSGSTVFARRAVISTEPLVIVRTRIHADFQAVEIQVGPLGPLTQDEPIPELRERERLLPRTAEPYYSGFTYRSAILDNGSTTLNFGDTSGWELNTFCPTTECSESFGDLAQVYQPIKRLATSPFSQVWAPKYGGNGSPIATNDPDDYRFDVLGRGGFTASDHNSCKPCLYTGKMAEVVSLLLGYGRWNYEDFNVQDPTYLAKLQDEGMRIEYNSKFVRCHGVIVSTEGNLWIVEISQLLGVIAWRMTYLDIPSFPLPSYYNYPIESFGGYPDGYCVPYNEIEVDALIASGQVIQLMSAADYTSQFYNGANSYNSYLGWAFNPDGTEARITCMRNKDDAGFTGIRHHEYWRMDLSINDSNPLSPTGSASLTELQSHPLFFAVRENAAVAGEYELNGTNTGTIEFFAASNGDISNAMQIQGRPGSGLITTAEANYIRSTYTSGVSSAVVWVAWIEDHWEEVTYRLVDDGNGGLGGLFYNLSDFPVYPTDPSFAGQVTWNPPTNPPYRILQEFYPGIPKGQVYIPGNGWGLALTAFVQPVSTTWTPSYVGLAGVPDQFKPGVANNIIFNNEINSDYIWNNPLNSGVFDPNGYTSLIPIWADFSFTATTTGVLGVRAVTWESQSVDNAIRETTVFVAAPDNRSAIFGFKIFADGRDIQQRDVSHTMAINTDVGYEVATSQAWSGQTLLDSDVQYVFNHPYPQGQNPTRNFPAITNSGFIPKASYVGINPPDSSGPFPTGRDFTDNTNFWEDSGSPNFDLLPGLSRKSVTYLNVDGPPGGWGPPTAGDIDTQGFTPKDFIEQGGFTYNVNVGPVSTTEEYLRNASTISIGAVMGVDGSAVTSNWNPSPWALEGLVSLSGGLTGTTYVAPTTLTPTSTMYGDSFSEIRTAYEGDIPGYPNITVDGVLIGHRLPGGPVLNVFSLTNSGISLVNNFIHWCWMSAFGGNSIWNTSIPKRGQGFPFHTAQVAMWGQRGALISNFDETYLVTTSNNNETHSWGVERVGTTAPLPGEADSRVNRLLTFIGYNDV